MRPVHVDAKAMVVLHRALKALERVVDGRERVGVKELPRWLPDGSQIATIPQLAAVLNTNDVVAAFHVLDARNPDPELLAQAKDVVGGHPEVCGVSFVRRPRRTEIIERPKPGLRVRRRRKRKLTEVKD